jgi:peptide deformylase
MAVRQVRIYGDPVLRQKAVDVTVFDESLRSLVADLFDTMKVYRGVGLAAPQVGVAQRVFVVDVPVEDAPNVRLAVVNPVLDTRSGKETSEEGCLSMPGIYEDVTRSAELRLRAFDEHGNAFERRVDGYFARAVQHESDHLDGVLFTDRLSPLKRQFLRRQLDALARGEVPEGYHPTASQEEDTL